MLPGRFDTAGFWRAVDVVFPPKPRSSLKRPRVSAEDLTAGPAAGPPGSPGSPTAVAADALTALYVSSAAGRTVPPPWSPLVMLPFMGLSGGEVRPRDVADAAAFVADTKARAEAHAASLRRDAEEQQHIDAGSDDAPSSPAQDSSYDDASDDEGRRARRRAASVRRHGVPSSRLAFTEGDGLGPETTAPGSGGPAGSARGRSRVRAAGAGRSASRSPSRSPSRARSLSANGARDFVGAEVGTLAVLTSRRVSPADAAAAVRILQSGVALNAAGIVAADASLAAAAGGGYDSPGAGGPSTPPTWATARDVRDVAVLFADWVGAGREEEAKARLNDVARPALSWNCDLLRTLVAARKFRAASLVLARVFGENSQAWPFEGSDSCRIAASLAPVDTRHEAGVWWRTLRDAYMGVADATRKVLYPGKMPKGLESMEGLRVQPRLGMQRGAARTINHALAKYGLDKEEG